MQETTGWCASCSRLVGCAQCGREFKDAGIRSLCSTCRSKNWIEENIDSIEEHIIMGLPVREAIQAVRAENKRECFSCGKVIDKGNFCTTNLECRKAYNRYKWKRRKGLDVTTAIREAVNERSPF